MNLWSLQVNKDTFTTAPVLSPLLSDKFMLSMREIQQLFTSDPRAFHSQAQAIEKALEAQNKNNKSKFLSLPQELRDRILEEAMMDEFSADDPAANTSKSLLLTSRKLFADTTRILLREREFNFDVKRTWLTARFAQNDETKKLSYRELMGSEKLDGLNPLTQTGNPFLIDTIKLAKTGQAPFEMVRNVKLNFKGSFKPLNNKISAQCFSERLDPFFGLVVLASMGMSNLRCVRLHFARPLPNGPTPDALQTWMAARTREAVGLMLQGMEFSKSGVRIMAEEAGCKTPFFDEVYENRPEEVDVTEEIAQEDGSVWEYFDDEGLGQATKNSLP